MKGWSAGLTALMVIALAAGVVGGVELDRRVFNPLPISDNSSAKFELVAEAWSKTRDVYVDRSALDPTRMAYGAIDGMVTSLGDTGHSTFLTPEMVKQEQNFEQGQLNGIGLEVQAKNGQVIIVAPLDNSPAQKAGLKAGDIILAVDKTPVQSVIDASSRILGPPGTSVTLTIQSPSGQVRDVTVVRARIQLKSVTYAVLPGTSIGHLRIATFATGATRELQDALTALQNQGISALVLDLRDDPGGLLDEAVATASQFLDQGNVLLEKSADGSITPVPVEKTQNPTFTLPVAVLINSGTASGAEIVAGALHDNNRAKLIGQTTFGTGTVLTQFPLSDGSALLLAIQEWLTPSGKTIWHQGLAPDVPVALAADAVPLFPEAESGMTKQQLAASADKQLLGALGLIGGQ